MLIEFPGFATPDDLQRAISSVFEMLDRHGLRRVSSVSLNFLAWSDGGDRLQLVDKNNRIASIGADAASLPANAPMPVFQLPDTISVRVRPADLEFSLLAISAGLDD